MVVRSNALLHILTKGLAGARKLTPNIENEPSQILEGCFKTFYTALVLVRPLVTFSVQYTVVKRIIHTNVIAVDWWIRSFHSGVDVGNIYYWVSVV